MDTPTPRTNCRLCGDPSAQFLSEDDLSERDWFDDPACVEASLCGPHLGEFQYGFCQKLGRQASRDDLNRWIANLLLKLTELKIGVHRCEVLYPANTNEGRCFRFAATVWNGHYVCGRHNAHLLAKRAKKSALYLFDGQVSGTTLRIEQMVTELLEG